MSDNLTPGIEPAVALAEALGIVEPLVSMTRQEMRTYLETARVPLTPGSIEDAGDYDDVSRFLGKVTLTYLDAHPEHRHLGHGKYELRPPGNSIADLVEIEPSLYDAIQQDDPSTAALLGTLGHTGFMWGWALAAAQYVLEIAPSDNPAIMDIE